MNKPNTQVASCETTHTPGPWTVGKKNRIQAGNVILIGEYEITSPARNDLYAANEEADANARLIAAAPDLLSELEDLVAFVETYVDGMTDCQGKNILPDFQGHLDAAKDAITKAEGKPL